MPANQPVADASAEARIGITYALLTYGAWGFLTLYWKWVAWLPSLQAIAHRVSWSLLLLLILLTAIRKLPELWGVLRQPRLLGTLLFSGALISVNWLLFVWAVANEHVVQASLGYFINPLFNVLLGVAVLHERLRKVQWFAVALAFAGVLWQVWMLGEWPWVSLSLAATFAIYGLIRKFTPVSSMIGLSIETMLLVPFSLAYLVWISMQADAVTWTSQGGMGILAVMLSGLITTLPLIWFANAARRLPLATLGFIQYIAPSLQLLIAVFVYHEPFTHDHLISFGMIWVALIIFSVDSLLSRRH